MLHPSGFIALLALGLLASRAVAAPAPTARSDASVSSSNPIIALRPI